MRFSERIIMCNLVLMMILTLNKVLNYWLIEFPFFIYNYLLHFYNKDMENAIHFLSLLSIQHKLIQIAFYSPSIVFGVLNLPFPDLLIHFPYFHHRTLLPVAWNIIFRFFSDFIKFIFYVNIFHILKFSINNRANN